MSSWSRSLLGWSAFASIVAGPAAVRTISNLIDPSSFDLECGRGGSGAPGVVVVQLLDRGVPRHGSLMLTGAVLEPEEQGIAGTIRIESNAGGPGASCEATGPGHFRMHGTVARLAGTTLRVVAMAPVEVVVEQSSGEKLASRVVDPSSSVRQTIRW